MARNAAARRQPGEMRFAEATLNKRSVTHNQSCEHDVCPARDRLVAEWGDDLYALHAHKLLVRGWAGRTSPIERAYIRSHKQVSDALAKQRSLALLKGRIAGAKRPVRRSGGALDGSFLDRESDSAPNGVER